MATDEKAPQTIGIIMDGNRRWAHEHGRSTLEGHQEGYENLKRFVDWAHEAKIKTVIAYAFSTENWNRAADEVGYLMNLLREVLRREIDELIARGIRLRFIGDRNRFDADITASMAHAEEKTASGAMNLVLAVSYGGRAEILRAAQRFADDMKDRAVAKEEDFAKFLWTSDIPDPELILRTGGRHRLSNFLPWQSVYTEFYVSDTLWPAFTKEEFHALLDRYAESVQNYGR